MKKKQIEKNPWTTNKTNLIYENEKQNLIIFNEQDVKLAQQHQKTNGAILFEVVVVIVARSEIKPSEFMTLWYTYHITMRCNLRWFVDFGDTNCIQARTSKLPFSPTHIMNF